MQDDPRNLEPLYATPWPDGVPWCQASIPDATRLVSLAEAAVAAGHRGPENRFRLGLAEYRAGRFCRRSDEHRNRSRNCRRAIMARWSRSTRPCWPWPTTGWARPMSPGATRRDRTHRLAGHREMARYPGLVPAQRLPRAETRGDRADHRQAGAGDPWLCKRRGEAYAKLGQTDKAHVEFRAADVVSQ